MLILKRDSLKDKIKMLLSQGFFHILLGGTLTKVIAFISSILIVRFVSKEDYAYLTYADNLYSYIYLFACFGLDTAVLKYCINEDKRKNKGYFLFAFRTGMLIEMILIVIIVIAINIFPVAFEQSRAYLYALLLYPTLYFIVCLLQAFMRARLKNKEFAYAGIIQTGIVLLVSVSLVFVVSAFSVIIARYCAAVIVIAYCFYILRDELNTKETIILTRDNKREFVMFGISLLIANVFSMIMPINEVFLVNNVIRDTTVTANYKVASLIPQQLGFITSAIITFYFPYFARMVDRKEIWEKSKNVGLVTGGIISGIVIIGAILSPVIIRITYGNKYSDINLLMTVLWVVYGINAGFRMLPMNILPAIGYTRFNMVLSIATCVVHFVIDYYLIKSFGVNGAAIAGAIVYSLTGFAYWAYLRSKLKR